MIIFEKIENSIIRSSLVKSNQNRKRYINNNKVKVNGVFLLDFRFAIKKNKLFNSNCFISIAQKLKFFIFKFPYFLQKIIFGWRGNILSQTSKCSKPIV